MNWQFAVSCIATILVFIGYAPYIRDTLAGKTKPHAYTWGIGLIVTAVSLWGLIIGKAGWPIAVVTAVLLLTVFIFLLSLKLGVRKGTTFDNQCLTLCFAVLPLWLLTKSPLYSILLLNLIDAAAFAPTVVKAYYHPYSETLFSYQVNVIRFVLLIAGLEYFSFINLIYPVTWLVCNLAFVAIVYQRRAKLVS